MTIPAKDVGVKVVVGRGSFMWEKKVSPRMNGCATHARVPLGPAAAASSIPRGSNHFVESVLLIKIPPAPTPLFTSYGHYVV
jgi:hypothetical protein